MNLYCAIDTYKKISILGMSKNSGKTVVLNEMIDICKKKKRKVCLTSIGVDGEGRDIVYKTQKPKIYAYEGTLIATSEEALKSFSAKYEIIDILPFSTCLGRIVIVKIIRDGYVLLAGPDSNREIAKVSDMMLTLGGDIVLIDGALNRKTQGSPSITDACILSTGASLSRDINITIKKTKHTVDMLSLNKVQEDILNKINTLNFKNVLLIGDNTIDTNIKTSLGNEDEILNRIDKNIKYIYLPGSLTGTFLNKIKGLEVDIIVKDGTKIFINREDYDSFRGAGGNIYVLERINLICVTQNPTSPFGYYYNPDVFLQNLRRALYPLDVYDVLYEGVGV
ncbi:MAG: hypothetical protein JG776_1871 [Caloramator sp.]|jgi:hypothetical protein|uniref:lysine 5,6-aminomutase reactivase subunit KamB n=1 Tax=Caloramator sp. TaxID=1871330 RepID=UPI001D69CCD8|nr:hypothetical protein [Caloramator sp.]MBZ4664156.1 hypothetical protein [Caloramator sp.]